MYSFLYAELLSGADSPWGKRDLESCSDYEAGNTKGMLHAEPEFRNPRNCQELQQKY